MSDSDAGAWAGAPIETTTSTSDRGTSVYTSPNYGDGSGETAYRAQVMSREDGSVEGVIFMHNSNTGDHVCLRYSKEGGTMDDMGEALETLEEGGVPDAEAADAVNSGDTAAFETDNGEETKDPEVERRRFNLWRFLGLKKNPDNGFHIPFDNEDFDEMNGGKSGPMGGIPGPIVLWATDNQAGIRAVGGREVNAWMEKNL